MANFTAEEKMFIARLYIGELVFMPMYVSGLDGQLFYNLNFQVYKL